MDCLTFCPLHFRFGFIDNLTLGGPTPLGARAANLTEMTRPFMEEIALNEQGHALFTRQAGSTIPCPLVDFDGGFNDFMAAAYGLADGVSVADQFGSAYGKLSHVSALPCCPHAHFHTHSGSGCQ